MVDAETRVTGPAVSLVVPECIDPTCGMNTADSVDPSRVEQTVECRSWCRLNECIPGPRLGRVDVVIRRHDIVVACQHDRNGLLPEVSGMRNQPLEPCHLVFKLGAR